MPRDFDLRALKDALDAQRATLGVSWTALAAELGISPATLRGLGTRPVAEGDGVLRMVAWLGRIPESFVPGNAGTFSQTPLPAPAGELRFDVPKLFAALDAERASRGMTWQEIAVESGVRSAAILTRMRAGGRVMFPQVMHALAWLDAPAARFVRVAR